VIYRILKYKIKDSFKTERRVCIQRNGRPDRQTDRRTRLYRLS